jgi:hypothetical protein
VEFSASHAAFFSPQRKPELVMQLSASRRCKKFITAKSTVRFLESGSPDQARRARRRTLFAALNGDKEAGELLFVQAAALMRFHDESRQPFQQSAACTHAFWALN